MSPTETALKFGNTALPREQQEALHRAIKFEWITLAFLAVSTLLVFLVLGNSQAMKAAWIEDLLSFLPPIAFLLAVRLIRRPPTEKHPYGYHRSVGIAHLVAAVALVAMGSFLIVDSGAGLLSAEHPTIGGVELFGQTVWLGWLMVTAMVLTAAPPVYLGRVKIKLAEKLHDKVLYADADMNKADWMTAGAAAVLGRPRGSAEGVRSLGMEGSGHRDHPGCGIAPGVPSRATACGGGILSC